MRRYTKTVAAVTLGLGIAASAGTGVSPESCAGEGTGLRRAAALHPGAGMGPLRGRIHAIRGKAAKGMNGVMMRRILGELDLTPTQRRQIRLVLLEEKKERLEKRIDAIKAGKRVRHLRRKRMSKPDLSRFMDRERFDKEAFKKAMIERWREEDEFRRQRRAARLERVADRMEKIFRILTPEQREKLIELNRKN
jgi:Spy/CpxP family protein refolding chaperone